MRFMYPSPFMLLLPLYDIFFLTHWGCVTHTCVSKLTIIGSDNGLLSDWCQAIIWTKVGILLIGHLGTSFSRILIEIPIFSFKKMHLKRSSGKWWPFWLGLNVLKKSTTVFKFPFKALFWCTWLKFILKKDLCEWLSTDQALGHYLNQGAHRCIYVSLEINDLTHLPLDKMAAILQRIFSDAFSWMKSFVFWLKFHWSLFLRV